jgi:hypothetical protein
MGVSAHVPGSEPDEAWTFAGTHTANTHAVDTPRWKPMRESCTDGFVRGAGSNPRPYRDRNVPTITVRVGTARRACLCQPYA